MDWFPPMADGVGFAGGGLEPGDLGCVSYGQMFRPPARALAVDVPALTAADVLPGLDEQLLGAWWAEAARVDGSVISPDARTLGTPQMVQAALRALSDSRFFAGLALRALIFDLHQVRRYLTEPELRAAIRQQVVDAVGEDTRVVVGHSLGSMVAYEVLCAHPEWSVHSLVTLGSPLGIRNLIFDRLEPAPTVRDGQASGSWPGPIRRWTNVVDAGDVVALVKDLRPLFGDQVDGFVVTNGVHAHDVSPYLTDEATGAAIVAGLMDD